MGGPELEGRREGGREGGEGEWEGGWMGSKEDNDYIVRTVIGL